MGSASDCSKEPIKLIACQLHQRKEYAASNPTARYHIKGAISRQPASLLPQRDEPSSRVCPLCAGCTAEGQRRSESLHPNRDSPRPHRRQDVPLYLLCNHRLEASGAARIIRESFENHSRTHDALKKLSTTPTLRLFAENRKPAPNKAPPPSSNQCLSTDSHATCKNQNNFSGRRRWHRALTATGNGRC